MVNEELIGFYKGCINTLAGERQALINMINDVDKLIQMHMDELRKLGVDVDSMVNQAKSQNTMQQSKPAENYNENQVSNNQNENYDYYDERVG